MILQSKKFFLTLGSLLMDEESICGDIAANNSVVRINRKPDKYPVGNEKMMLNKVDDSVIIDYGTKR